MNPDAGGTSFQASGVHGSIVLIGYGFPAASLAVVLLLDRFGVSMSFHGPSGLLVLLLYVISLWRDGFRRGTAMATMMCFAGAAGVAWFLFTEVWR